MTSKTLVTFPGRAGDLLWALPTVRAISESLGHPVDLQIAGEFAGMVDLLLQQPYLAGVVADPRWSMSQPETWKAPELPQQYERVYHLGYRRWPELSLPQETFQQACAEGAPLGDLGLERPWITVSTEGARERKVVCGWSDCYFELKSGLVDLLKRSTRTGYAMRDTWRVLVPPGSRWATERSGHEEAGDDWVKAAQWIANSRVFLGDCSALHVLACALGKPVVCYEPMEARWNSIFYPYGMDGPQVTVVKGNDGLPTCDARHTAETLEKVLNVTSR